MRKSLTFLAGLTAVATGVFVLQLKSTVQDKKKDVTALALQIHDDKEAMRVIEAEWAYLTTPRLLQERSIQFLALMPPRARQILTNPTVIPMRPDGAVVEEDPGVLLPAALNSKSNNKKKRKATRDNSKEERKL